LGIEIPTREVTIAERDGGLARSLLSRWLPLANAVLQMAVEHMPSPDVSQPKRITALFNNVSVTNEGNAVAVATEELAKVSLNDESSGNSSEKVSASVFKAALNAISQSVASCDQASPLAVAFISKMTSVNANELKCLDGRTTWKPPKGTTNSTTSDGGGGGGGGEEEVLVAFARVFSGTLRVIDMHNAEEEDNDYMYVMGPKYVPQEHLSMEAVVAAGKGGGSDNNNDDKMSFKLTPNNDTSGNVTAITAKSKEVLQGNIHFELPQLAPFSKHQQDDETMADGDTEGDTTTTTTTATGSGTSGGDHKSVPWTNSSKSPIALYMMMGDSFVPVPAVPAGSLCAIAGLDAYSTAKCMTLVVGPKWTAICPPFKPLAMQVCRYYFEYCV
jgi:translation elongation factor EF-G